MSDPARDALPPEIEEALLRLTESTTSPIALNLFANKVRAYINDLRLQSESWRLTSKVGWGGAEHLEKEAERRGMERALQAVADEPELPGRMPDETWGSILGDRDATEQALRTTVRRTKEEITKRIALFMEEDADDE